MSSNCTDGCGGTISASGRREQVSAILDGTETLADYISKCALLEHQTPILAFPRREEAYDNFEKFRAGEINDLADRAAVLLIRQGLTQLSEETSVTVTLLGQGSLQYVATVLALVKLGYSVLVMSPRLSAPIVVALLDKTESRFIVFTGNLEAKIKEIEALRDVRTLPMVTRTELHFDGVHFQPPNYDTRIWSRSSKVTLIWHSSGSTGIPKVFPMTHKTIMSRLRFATKAQYFGKPLFLTSSVYNSAGSTMALLALCNAETTYYYNDFLPYTAEGLTKVMQEARPHTVFTVPYALGQLATSSAGVEALKKCSSVNSFGAVCPTALGNKLVEQGIRLNSGYAMSETSPLMNSSFRDASTDKAWDYLAPYPNTKDHIWMKPLTTTTTTKSSSDLHECVILPGLATCPISNSDDPRPGSFHTGDVFIPHPTLPNRWKAVGRRDDIINMSFLGGSIVALPLENDIGAHPLVAEAVIFGNGRPKLGLLVFGSPAAQHLTPAQVVARLWPSVEDMNARQTQPWTRIERDMVLVVPPGGPGCPRTDKLNIIRPQVYRQFDKEIDNCYQGLN